MRKKSVKKEAKCKQNVRIVNWAQKSQANLMWLRLKAWQDLVKC